METVKAALLLIIISVSLETVALSTVGAGYSPSNITLDFEKYSKIKVEFRLYNEGTENAIFNITFKSEKVPFDCEFCNKELFIPAKSTKYKNYRVMNVTFYRPDFLGDGEILISIAFRSESGSKYYYLIDRIKYNYSKIIFSNSSSLFIYVPSETPKKPVEVYKKDDSSQKRLLSFLNGLIIYIILILIFVFLYIKKPEWLRLKAE